MRKELVEKLREASYSASHGEMADLLHEAADALEAKAAPVGEREAFETIFPNACGYEFRDNCYHLPEREKYTRAQLSQHGSYSFAWMWFCRGAAHQRQQVREVVMPERMTPHFNDNHYAAAWNACLDEIARLNKGAGSHE